METINVQQIKQDLKELVESPGWSTNRVAKESGVDQASLHRFLNGPQKSLHLVNLCKLWPYLYGDKRPEIVDPQ